MIACGKSCVVDLALLNLANNPKKRLRKDIFLPSAPCASEFLGFNWIVLFKYFSDSYKQEEEEEIFLHVRRTRFFIRNIESWVRA